MRREAGGGRRGVQHALIAREGWPHLVIAGAISLVASVYLGGWSWPFWAIFVFILQFFRDPPRVAPQEEGIVVSAADGRVLVVEKTRDHYLEREALKISVFMNVFNVHSNRSPVDGKIERTWYNTGSFFNAALDKASSDNERQALWIKTTSGEDIACVQIAGLIARRILCYVKEGDAVVRAQRYGFIRFGSRVDLYLPASARPLVSVGDITTAGETIVARLG
ncbi:MAG: phosphatidylserine decarboxylase [Betaproteobacteria bacterium]|nr:phosphatidylserine decarboxylase [Betaproteobacteria bacterium]